MRAAVIENGLVVNVIEIASFEDAPGLDLVASDFANIGDGWNGTTFSSPSPPPADELDQVSARQIRAALAQGGASDATIDALFTLAATL